MPTKDLVGFFSIWHREVTHHGNDIHIPVEFNAGILNSIFQLPQYLGLIRLRLPLPQG